MKDIEQVEKRDEKLEAVLDKIMTAEEYAQIRHERPYIFELKDGDKELSYFGARHSYDPENSQFSELEKVFDEVSPDIVFVEGISKVGNKKERNEKVKSTSRDEMIKNIGEPGLAIKLAVEKGIEWRSPEPSGKDLYNFCVEQGFSKDEIFAWVILHLLPQYQRGVEKSGFKNYVHRFIERFREDTNWENFDYTYENGVKIAEQIIGRQIDVENESNAGDFVDPIPWDAKKENQTVINRVGRATSVFRDRKIVSEIIEAFNNHKKVFVVFGASHAVMQEPALKEFFRK